jgi:hypothetical protein
MIQTGDQVKLIHIPPDIDALPEGTERTTKTLFRQCLGHVFTVRAVHPTVLGITAPGLLELWPTQDGMDGGSDGQAIWVEPEDVEVA